MQFSWQVTTFILCSYGFFKAFRPGEPFLTDFLGPPNPNNSLVTKNFTLDIIYGDIYPFWTYSYLFFLIPIFTLTDLLRYKPVLVFETISLAATWAALIWGYLHIFYMHLIIIDDGYWALLFKITTENNYNSGHYLDCNHH